jgi:hypothetical protein
MVVTRHWTGWRRHGRLEVLRPGAPEASGVSLEDTVDLKPRSQSTKWRWERTTLGIVRSCVVGSPKVSNNQMQGVQTYFGRAAFADMPFTFDRRS